MHIRVPVIAAAGLVLVLAACGHGHAPGATASTGSWQVAYDGFGRVISDRSAGSRLFTLEPARPSLTAPTHSALVLSRSDWGDFAFTVRVRTVAQLRNPHPNPWEVAWVLWHYADERHFYYLILKPNGFELGKEHPGSPGGQRFLATGGQPRFPVGPWYLVRVEQRADVITISVDGRQLLQFTDTHEPYRTGRIGLYTEDARATYQPVQLSSAH